MPLYLTFTSAKVKIKLPSYFFPNSHGWRGMLQIDEVKFTAGWNFTPEWDFFEILVPFIRAENWKFPPGGEMNILTFLHDIF